MKNLMFLRRSAKSLLCCLIAAFAFDVMAQGLGPIHITTNRKRVDKEKKETGSHTISREEWVQVVELDNRSPRSMDNVTVKYRVYKLDDSHGAKRSEMSLIFEEGEHKIEVLERLKKEVFETTPVKIEVNSLKPGWYYTDGAKGTVKDRLHGVWLKIYEDGELIQEYINPTTLRTSHPWEE